MRAISVGRNCFIDLMACVADVRTRARSRNMPSTVAVVRLGGALIRLVVLHERRARGPLVREQSTEQPAAPLSVGAAGRLTQASERAEVQRLRALDASSRRPDR